jgi:hypothetical protein
MMKSHPVALVSVLFSALGSHADVLMSVTDALHSFDVAVVGKFISFERRGTERSLFREQPIWSRQDPNYDSTRNNLGDSADAAFVVEKKLIGSVRSDTVCFRTSVTRGWFRCGAGPNRLVFHNWEPMLKQQRGILLAEEKDARFARLSFLPDTSRCFRAAADLLAKGLDDPSDPCYRPSLVWIPTSDRPDIRGSAPFPGLVRAIGLIDTLRKVSDDTLCCPEPRDAFQREYACSCLVRRVVFAFSATLDTVLEGDVAEYACGTYVHTDTLGVEPPVPYRNCRNVYYFMQVGDTLQLWDGFAVDKYALNRMDRSTFIDAVAQGGSYEGLWRHLCDQCYERVRERVDPDYNPIEGKRRELLDRIGEITKKKRAAALNKEQ